MKFIEPQKKNQAVLTWNQRLDKRNKKGNKTLISLFVLWTMWRFLFVFPGVIVSVAWQCSERAALVFLERPSNFRFVRWCMIREVRVLFPLSNFGFRNGVQMSSLHSNTCQTWYIFISWNILCDRYNKTSYSIRNWSISHSFYLKKWDLAATILGNPWKPSPRPFGEVFSS